MQIKRVESLPLQEMTLPGVKGVSMRLLFSREGGAPNFAMRQFEVQPGGHTPLHHHPYEHEVFILEGEGSLETVDGPKPIAAGDAVFVGLNESHQFNNTGSVPLKFLCLVPLNEQTRHLSDVSGGGACQA